MIKDILEQLAPLDAQIAALKGSGSDMEAITAHASELAELAVEEDEILRSCGPLTAEDRVFSGPSPGTSAHRRDDLCPVHGFLRAARRPAVQGGHGHSGRRGPFPRDAGDGHRPPQGLHAGGKSGLQLWNAGAGGLPQGSAPDEAG